MRSMRDDTQKNNQNKVLNLKIVSIFQASKFLISFRLLVDQWLRIAFSSIGLTFSYCSMSNVKRNYTQKRHHSHAIRFNSCCLIGCIHFNNNHAYDKDRRNSNRIKHSMEASEIEQKSTSSNFPLETFQPNDFFAHSVVLTIWWTTEDARDRLVHVCTFVCEMNFEFILIIYLFRLQPKWINWTIIIIIKLCSLINQYLFICSIFHYPSFRSIHAIRCDAMQ